MGDRSGRRSGEVDSLAATAVQLGHGLAGRQLMPFPPPRFKTGPTVVASSLRGAGRAETPPSRSNEGSNRFEAVGPLEAAVGCVIRHRPAPAASCARWCGMRLSQRARAQPQWRGRWAWRVQPGGCSRGPALGGSGGGGTPRQGRVRVSKQPAGHPAVLLGECRAPLAVCLQGMRIKGSCRAPGWRLLYRTWVRRYLAASWAVG